ncbi:hypothetical protein ACFL35_16580 [Candidatus Riflebacteria bacterium]
MRKIFFNRALLLALSILLMLPADGLLQNNSLQAKTAWNKTLKSASMKHFFGAAGLLLGAGVTACFAPALLPVLVGSGLGYIIGSKSVNTFRKLFRSK